PDSDKEKRISNNLLVNASNVKEAFDRTNESMKGMMVSFDIPSIVLSPILDIFPFNEDEMEYHEQQQQAEDDSEPVGFKGATAGVFSASGSDDDDLEEEVQGVVEDDYDGEEE